MPSDSQPSTDEPAPMPRRLSEATAAFLLEFPRGYDLPPLEIIVQQINAALRAADAADAQGRSEAASDEARGTPFGEPIEAESRVTGIPQTTAQPSGSWPRPVSDAVNERLAEYSRTQLGGKVAALFRRALGRKDA